MIREYELKCPTCQGFILIDLESGEILGHGTREQGEAKKNATMPKALDDVLGRIRAREAAGDDTFSNAVKSVKDSKKKLDQAFEQAKEKAKKKPDDKPHNPFDFS